VPKLRGGEPRAREVRGPDDRLPPVQDADPVRSWITSPRWATIVGLGLLSIVALVVAAVMLGRREPPEGLPFVGSVGGEPQLAVPGDTLVVEWEAEQQSSGGYFRITSQTVSLVRGSGRPQALAVRGADRPWPGSLLEGAEAPGPTPILISLELDVPQEYTLSGSRVSLQASVEISFPARTKPGGPLEVQRATVRHERSFVVATEAQGNEFAAWKRRGSALRWLVFGCAALVIAIPIGAGALAQQHVTMKCPKCGRTTEATFYHEGGEYYVSPCPHRGGRPTEAEQ